MLKDLKERVWRANGDLMKRGLVFLTFGNASGIDRKNGLVAVKPSGVSFESLRPKDIVVVDLDGRIVEGPLKPSSDTPTHLVLYRHFPGIGGVSHAHSIMATAFAQSRREIPCLGTTHADHFNGPVPVTRLLTRKEVRENYEGRTGEVIIERFAGLDPLETPAVLVAGHGPFTWGRTAAEAVDNATALETVAEMAFLTFEIRPNAKSLPEDIRRKHFQRKHGPGAMYGQKRSNDR